MTTKETIEGLLERSEDAFIVTDLIAEGLMINRISVMRLIKQLESEGYEFEDMHRRGYRRKPGSDPLNAACIKRHLDDYSARFRIDYFDEIGSTNQYLKDRAEDLPEWTAAVAASQTGGRGRMGRSFYSPERTGVYMSMLLRPSIPAEDAVKITTAAAVAACLAIEEETREVPSIKWVNDIYVRGGKACGILTESAADPETGKLKWAVMGIGFNVYQPWGGFPEEIAETAGFISKSRSGDLRCRIAASFMRHFYDICGDLSDSSYIEEYKKRSFLPGKRVDVLRGETSVPAEVTGIDDECRLLVRYDDGSSEALSSGEVSVRQTDG